MNCQISLLDHVYFSNYLVKLLFDIEACMCVYGLTILMLLGWASRLNRVFLAYATTSPGRVESHFKDSWWYQNTCCLMVIKAGHSQNQWGDLVQVGGGIALEKGNGRIEDEQGKCHLMCCWSVVHHRKPFDVGIQEQPVRVLMEHHKLYCY